MQSGMLFSDFAVAVMQLRKPMQVVTLEKMADEKSIMTAKKFSQNQSI